MERSATTGEGVDIMCSVIHGVTSLPKNQNLGRLSAARGHQGSGFLSGGGGGGGGGAFTP